MERFHLCILIVLSVYILFVEGLPTGAPQEACMKMQPGDPHRRQWVNGQIKYYSKGPANNSTYNMYQVSGVFGEKGDYYYKENSMIKVRLTDYSGRNPFKGFLIRAYSGWNNSMVLGQFSVSEESKGYSQVTCNGTGLTHTHNYTKSFVEFYWTGPGAAWYQNNQHSDVVGPYHQYEVERMRMGSVFFKATVVRSKHEWYEDIFSDKYLMHPEKNGAVRINYFGAFVIQLLVLTLYKLM